MGAACWGDQSDGVIAGFDIPPSATSLFVFPSGTIAPPADEHGIFGIFDTSLSLFSETSIVTSGGGDAIAIEAPGALKIKSHGDLTSGRRGIYAFSYSDLVKVRSRGDIDAGEDGIFAQGDGPVSVFSHGTIDAAFKGIFANSFSNGVTVKSKGDINAYFDAIWAQGVGDVSVNSDGDLLSTNYAKGIFANSFSGGVTVTSHGDIESAHDNIWAQGVGDVSIWSVGNLMRGDTSAEGRGIFANSFDGGVTVFSDGDITSNLDGIWAKGKTGVDIVSYGDIYNPKHSRGIYADASLGPVSVMSEGNIDAYLDAIWARGYGAVNVHSRGNLDSRNYGHGIYAESLVSTAWVDSIGDISADQDGIFARGAGNVGVRNIGDISAPHAFGDQRGIFAQSLGGEVMVDHKGDIEVTLDSIWAQGTENVTVYSFGDLNSTRTSSKGIFASSMYKEVMVDSRGDINSSHEAIFADGGEDVTVFNDGDLTATDFRALFAQSEYGKVRIKSTGDILASGTISNGEAIFANGTDGVEIHNYGDLTSNSFRGIYAQSSNGPIEIYSMGNIRAEGTNSTFGEAIFVDNYGDVTVHTNGDLFSNEFRGVFLQSRENLLDFESTGTVMAEFEGLFLSGQDVNATIRGDVTSNEWRGILASREISGNPGGAIHLSYGGGTVKSNGTATDKQPHAMEVDAFGGSAFVTVEEDGTVLEQNNVASGNFSYGILFGEGTNLLTNYGEVITTDFAGRAIGGEGGDETIENMGLVRGSIYLGGGANLFNNRMYGLFESGDVVDLGAGNAVMNWGWLSPGGTGNYQTTTFTSGNLTQLAPGEIVVDVDFDTPATSDLITGIATADLDGFVRANLQDINLVYGTTQTVTVLEAASVIDNGITGAAQGAVEVNVVTDPTTVDITVGLNFAANGLTGNKAQMGAYLQDIFMSGVPGSLTTTFLGLVDIPTTDAYGTAIGNLGPDGSTGLGYAIADSNTNFIGNLFSCPVAVSVTAGASRFSDEGECAWLLAGARRTDMDASSSSLGLSDQAWSIDAGVQKSLGGNRRFGFAMGYETGDYSSGSTTGDRRLFSIGGVVKDRIGGSDFALAVTGGLQNADVSRMIVVGGPATATSDQSQHYLGVAARMARTYETNWGYFEPSVVGSGTWIHRDGYSETGAGVLNLVVAGGNEMVFRVAPAIEVGREQVVEGGVLRPFAQLGVSLQTGAGGSYTAGFVGMPQTIAFSPDRNDLQADISIGADFLADNGWSFRAQYQGAFSDGYSSNTASFKARRNF